MSEADQGTAFGLSGAEILRRRALVHRDRAKEAGDLGRGCFAAAELRIASKLEERAEKLDRSRGNRRSDKPESIADLRIEVRIVNLLENHGALTVADLVRDWTVERLLGLHGMGPLAVRRLRDALNAHGFVLRSEK